MAKPLIMYGASNSGDEFVQLFRDINKNPETADKWEILGLLDDNADVIGTVRNGIKVLGNRDWLIENHKDDYHYVCCIGKPSVKKKRKQREARRRRQKAARRYSR